LGGLREARQPLELFWAEGSDLIGDFVFAVPRLAAKAAVVQDLHTRFAGFEPGPVVMPMVPGAQRPRSRRVRLAYRGPALEEIWITRVVPLDLERSTVEEYDVCLDCGSRALGLDPATMERQPGDLAADKVTHLSEPIPRPPGKGIFVRREDVAEPGFFRLKEIWNPIFCTLEVKQFVEEHGYTNIGFREAGEAV
jgi:hypothetical protein